MLPERLSQSHQVHPVRTAVDAKLIERTGIDELSLRRIRKAFLASVQRLTYLERRTLSEGGTYPRFALMVRVLVDVWSVECWTAWLRYLEHTQQDIDEMCRGEYPVSPYIIRVFSALFGIKVDYLLLGTTPAVDKVGASIDVWPMQDAR